MDRGFWYLVPFARVPSWVPFFDPQPFGTLAINGYQSGKPKGHSVGGQVSQMGGFKLVKIRLVVKIWPPSMVAVGSHFLFLLIVV